jgi:hypothetical protein
MRLTQWAFVRTWATLTLTNFAFFCTVWIVKWLCVGVRWLMTLSAKHSCTTLEHGDVTTPIALDHCIVCAVLCALVLVRGLPVTARTFQFGNVNFLFNATIDSPCSVRLPTCSTLKTGDFSHCSGLSLLGRFLYQSIQIVNKIIFLASTQTNTRHLASQIDMRS